MEIKEALQLLDHKNDEQWTSDGVPLVSVVQELVGDTITVHRQMITDVDPSFTRESTSSSSSLEDPQPSGLEDVITPTKKDIDLQINDLQIDKDHIDKEMALLIRERDRLQMLEYKGQNTESDTKATMEFIKSQNKLRADRMATRRSILKNIDPSDLDPRSPIDRAMERKTARGTQRPVRSLSR